MRIMPLPASQPLVTSSEWNVPRPHGSRVRGGVFALRCLRLRAFIWKMTAVNSTSVNAAKQWIGRIVVGTIGVEMAGTLVQILTSSLGTH